ncbi:MAG: DUF4373 domain-containing protein [Firmicutes bacterium]|nr:DUF4373 domain-containing protein [Bacillota bacterium]
MARPVKRTVDYFPHDTHAASSKTMYILDAKFGNNGYAFWFKLLELLGSTADHVYDCRNPAEWGFLVAKMRMDEDSVERILDTLAELDAIDPELWKYRIIWSQNFVDRLADVYAKRKQDPPVRPNPAQLCATAGVFGPETRPETELSGQPGPETPQSKGKESKGTTAAASVSGVVSTTEAGSSEPDRNELAAAEPDKRMDQSSSRGQAIEHSGHGQVLSYMAKRLRMLPTQISGRDLADLQQDCARHGPDVVMRAIDLACEAQLRKGKHKRGDPALGPDIRSYQFCREFLNDAKELVEEEEAIRRDREIGARRRAETQALIDELLAAGGG